ADDIAIGAQRYVFVNLTTTHEDAVQFAPMNHGIGVAETLTEIARKIDMRDLFRGDRVHQPQLVDENGDGADGIAKLKAIEGVECVWAQLDAGPDFLVVRGALEHRDLKSLLSQRQRCR